MAYAFKNFLSPIGVLKLVASDKGLTAVLWENDRPTRVPLPALQIDESHSILCETEKQLREYFAGRLQKFDVPLDMQGTEFQRSVWEGLLQIPYGQTQSYGELARKLKKPNASRAVGAANGRNPISIIVPCHRVIGSNGQLTGFAGGVDVKAKLLELETQSSR